MSVREMTPLDLDRIALEVAEREYCPKDGFTPGFASDLKLFARALLQRLEQEGWQLVPKEPTEEMCMLAMITMMEENKGIEYAPYVGYKAMLSVAPKITN